MNAIELAEECGAVILGGVFMLDVNELQAFYEAAKQEGRDELQAKLQEEVEALHKQVVARDALLKAKDAALRDARASFLGLQPDFGGPISAQMGLAASRITKALSLDTAEEK